MSNEPINLSEQRVRFETTVARDINDIQKDLEKSEIEIKLLNNIVMKQEGIISALTKDVDSLKLDRRWIVTLILTAVIGAGLGLIFVGQQVTKNAQEIQQKVVKP